MLPSLSTNTWYFVGITLDFSRTTASFYLMEMGGTTVTSLSTNTGTLAANLGVATTGLQGQVLTIGNGFTGSIAQLQLWQVQLLSTQLVNLLLLYKIPFLPTLPDSTTPSLTLSTTETYLWNRTVGDNILTANLTSTSINSSTSISAITPSSPFIPSSTNYNFAIRFNQTDLINSSQIALDCSIPCWTTITIIDDNFVTIYFICTLVTSIPLSSESPPTLPIKIKGIIGATANLQYEVIYQNINTQTGFLLSESIPVYNTYIPSTQELIANFNFQNTPDGMTYPDASGNPYSGLSIYSPLGTPLVNDARFDYIYPLNGSNPLTIDASKAQIAASTDLTLSFWTKLDLSSLTTALASFITIKNGISIQLAKSSGTTPYLQIGLGSGLTATSTALSVEGANNEWLFWTIVMTSSSVNVWLWSPQSDTTSFSKASLPKPGLTLGSLVLSANTLTIGENWTGDFTNLCLWNTALANTQVNLLLSEYLNGFPVFIQEATKTIVTTAPTVSVSAANTPMKLSGTLALSTNYSISASSLSESAINLTNYHFAFVFRVVDLDVSSYTTGTPIQLSSSSNFSTNLIVQDGLVYFLLVAKNDITTTAVDYTIENIVAKNLQVLEIPVLVMYRVMDSNSTIINGTLSKLITFNTIQKYITSSLVTAFNFDQTTDGSIYQDNSGNGLQLMATPSIEASSYTPFGFTLPLKNSDSLSIDLQNTQLPSTSTELILSFWTYAIFSTSDTLTINLGGITIEITAPTAAEITIIINRQSQVSIDYTSTNWLFWVFNLNGLSSSLILYTQPLGGNLTEGANFSLPTDTLPSFLGKPMTIAVGTKSSINLAKLNLWQQTTALTSSTTITFEDYLKDIIDLQKLDLPTIAPSTNAAIITATPSDTHIFSTQNGNNDLTITLKSIGSGNSVTFDSTPNFNTSTFDPKQDNYICAICFRQDDLLDNGLNIRSVNPSLTASNVEMVTKKDSGGAILLRQHQLPVEILLIMRLVLHSRFPM